MWIKWNNICTGLRTVLSSSRSVHVIHDACRYQWWRYHHHRHHHFHHNFACGQESSLRFTLLVWRIFCVTCVQRSTRTGVWNHFFQRPVNLTYIFYVWVFSKTIKVYHLPSGPLLVFQIHHLSPLPRSSCPVCTLTCGFCPEHPFF